MDYKVKGGEWFWEYGMHLNTIYDAENARDHLLRAIYGTFSNVKQDKGNENLKLKWVGYVLGKRESRRIIGDYVLKEKDVRDIRTFPDGVVEEKREIDLHYPKGGKYDFLSRAEFTPVEQYQIPYPCFYAKDVDNLFLAGRCFSASHVGLGSPRVMNTCGQMGVVTGVAASLCKKYECNPRSIYLEHLQELKKLLEEEKI